MRNAARLVRALGEGFKVGISWQGAGFRARQGPLDPARRFRTLADLRGSGSYRCRSGRREQIDAVPFRARVEQVPMSPIPAKRPFSTRRR